MICGTLQMRSQTLEGGMVTINAVITSPGVHSCLSSSSPSLGLHHSSRGTEHCMQQALEEPREVPSHQAGLVQAHVRDGAQAWGWKGPPCPSPQWGLSSSCGSPLAPLGCTLSGERLVALIVPRGAK